MWVEWLTDEINLKGPEEEIAALFETALSNYHYRKVYKLYLKHLMVSGAEEDHSPIFERALKVWGLDVEKGNAMWELYAQYAVSKSSYSNSSDQIKLLSITRRRCTQPILGSKEVFCAYIPSETDQVKADRTRAKHEAA